VHLGVVFYGHDLQRTLLVLQMCYNAPELFVFWMVFTVKSSLLLILHVACTCTCTTESSLVTCEIVLRHWKWTCTTFTFDLKTIFAKLAKTKL